MKMQVKIGVGFGLWRMGLPTANDIVRVAEMSEAWGLDSFWLSDHLLAPSAELDVVASLALIATRTSRIKLGPSVFLLNLRHPLLAAKSFATLDYLSGGRIVMAVGTGSNLADYPACGLPLEGRGARLDEGIEVLRKVWLEENVSYHGKFFNFDNVTLEPRPVPRHHNDFGTIDLWVGGSAEGALRRTAKYADGYFASFRSPAEITEDIAKIRQYAAQYGRANGRIETGLILLCRLGESQEKALEELAPVLRSLDAEKSRLMAERTVCGSPEQVMERLAEYTKVGLDKFVLWPVAAPADWPKHVELIGREIASRYSVAA